MKRAGKIIALILMGVIISMNLLTVVGNLAGASGDFSLLPYTLLSVQSGSMEPEMSVGDLIIDHEVPYEDIKVGDTVTFESNGEFITHRVIRFDGSRLVTKGIANNAEDRPFGPENYLGKTVAVIPGLGRVLSFFSNPWSLLCALVVLFGIFYGGKIADRITHKKRAFSPVRLLSFLLAASFLFLTPTMTAAKYSVLLNGATALAADTRYFSSNMLSKEGTAYQIDGWTGGSYGLTTSVTSGENLLKYNKTGQDVVYKFYFMKLTSDGTQTYNSNYSFTVMPQDGVTEVPAEDVTAFTLSPTVRDAVAAAGAENVTEAGPYTLQGDDSRIVANNFNILLQGDSSDPLKAGDRIRYKIFAVTDYATGYYQQLSADVSMTISPAQDFIETSAFSTEEGNNIVKYELTTGLSGGSGARDVKVSWDNTVLYLNEYENNAYEIIHNRAPECYYRGTATDHTAYLIMSLTAYSSIELEFFKYDPSLVTGIQINASLYNGETEAQEETTAPDTTNE